MKDILNNFQKYIKKDNLTKILGLIFTIFAIFFTMSRFFQTIIILFFGKAFTYYSELKHIFAIASIFLAYILIIPNLDKDNDSTKYVPIFYLSLLFIYFTSMINELINKFLLSLAFINPNINEIQKLNKHLITGPLKGISFVCIYFTVIYLLYRYILKIDFSKLSLVDDKVKEKQFNIFNELTKQKEKNENIVFKNIIPIGKNLNNKTVYLSNIDIFNNIVFSGNIDTRNSNILLPILETDEGTNSFIFLENEATYNKCLDIFKDKDFQIIDSNHHLSFGINPFNDNIYNSAENVIYILQKIFEQSKYTVIYNETLTFLKNISILLKLTYPKENGLPNLKDFIKLLKNMSYIKILNDQLKEKYLYLKKYNILEDNDLKIYKDIYIYFEENIFSNISNKTESDTESDEQKIFRDIFNILPILDSFLNKKENNIFLNKSKNLDFNLALNTPTIIFVGTNMEYKYVLQNFLLYKVNKTIEDSKLVLYKSIIFTENIMSIQKEIENNFNPNHLAYISGVDNFNIIDEDLLNNFKIKVQYISEYNTENILRLGEKINSKLNKDDVNSFINYTKKNNLSGFILNANGDSSLITFYNKDINNSLKKEKIKNENEEIKKVLNNEKKENTKTQVQSSNSSFTITDLKEEEKKKLSENISIFLENIEKEEFEKKNKNKNKNKKKNNKYKTKNKSNKPNPKTKKETKN